jgi:hypothetical protein
MLSDALGRSLILLDRIGTIERDIRNDVSSLGEASFRRASGFSLGTRSDRQQPLDLE